MPLSREEFDQRRIDLIFPIARLLARRPDLAFTADEVRQMLIETEGRNAALDEVEQALETLVAQARAQKAEFNGQQWYTIVRRRLGFLRE